MRRALRIAVPIICCAVLFAVLRLFQFQLWTSVTVAVLAGLFIFLGEAFDFVKKPLELAKLCQEIAKLRHEAKKERENEEERKRLVRLATPSEIKEYGAPYVERAVRRHYRQEDERDRLSAKRFVADSHEERDDAS
jgi:hypothetical protein